MEQLLSGEDLKSRTWEQERDVREVGIAVGASGADLSSIDCGTSKIFCSVSVHDSSFPTEFEKIKFNVKGTVALRFSGITCGERS